MPNKNKKKLEGMQQGLVSRSAVYFQPDTIKEDDTSVEFVLTTEYPATVPDWERWEMVQEVLRADGVALPDNKQVPLLNSHDRSKIENILGSVREIRTDGKKVVGRLFFSKVPAAQEAFEKIKEGHLDSGSVGYSQTKSKWIEKDESFMHNGERYEGPMLLTTDWALKEFSLVAVGADPYAKAREEVPAIEKPEIEKEIDSVKAVPDIKPEETNMDSKETKTEQPLTVDTEAIKREAIKAEQVRASTITDLCQRHNLPEIAVKLIADGETIERAQAMILDSLSKKTQPVAGANKPEVEMGETDKEKFRAAATDGMLMRGGMRVKDAAAGAESFRGLGFSDIARAALIKEGVDVSLMGREAILQRAMTTSDFPLILANSANKAMLMGYQAAPSSWRAWAKQGVLSNFNSATRLQISDAPDLLEVVENGEITNGVMTERGETISLTTFARNLIISRQALVNDDLGVFDRLFRAFGFRAANLIESIAYGILTDNANMADGGALFNTTAVTTTGGHANMASSGGALSATTVTAAEVALMNQVAPQGSKLSIMPRYLLTGSAYKIAAALLVNSTNDTTLTSNASYNPFNDLTAIASAHITGNKWYMIGDPNQIDTVEVAFLNGKDTPTLNRIDNEGSVLQSKFEGFIDIGAKALEYRGMYYNAGA